MLSLILGGSGSGKSVYAEERVLALSKGKKYYLATMRVYGEEGRKKVERHQKLRENKGFETIEKTEAIKGCVEDPTGTVLLECMSNLVANEMFQEDKVLGKNEVIKKIMEGIWDISKKVEHLIIVSNNVFEDGVDYDEGTRTYIQTLGEVNACIAKEADEVFELVVGIPVQWKG